jgi:hypothetical protein
MPTPQRRGVVEAAEVAAGEANPPRSCRHVDEYSGAYYGSVTVKLFEEQPQSRSCGYLPHYSMRILASTTRHAARATWLSTNPT